MIPTSLPSSTRAVDDKTKGTFPGLTLNNNTLQRGLGLTKWLTSNIGSDADNWVGGNRMGWSNAQFDRLYEQSKQLPDSPERTALYRKMSELVQVYAPWHPGHYTYRSALVQPWVRTYKMHAFIAHPWEYVDIQ